jgi:hypothetical protein
MHPPLADHQQTRTSSISPDEHSELTPTGIDRVRCCRRGVEALPRAKPVDEVRRVLQRPKARPEHLPARRGASPSLFSAFPSFAFDRNAEMLTFGFIRTCRGWSGRRRTRTRRRNEGRRSRRSGRRSSRRPERKMSCFLARRRDRCAHFLYTHSLVSSLISIPLAALVFVPLFLLFLPPPSSFFASLRFRLLPALSFVSLRNHRNFRISHSPSYRLELSRTLSHRAVEAPSGKGERRNLPSLPRRTPKMRRMAGGSTVLKGLRWEDSRGDVTKTPLLDVRKNDDSLLASSLRPLPASPSGFEVLHRDPPHALSFLFPFSVLERGPRTSRFLLRFLCFIRLSFVPSSNDSQAPSVVFGTFRPPLAPTPDLLPPLPRPPRLRLPPIFLNLSHLIDTLRRNGREAEHPGRTLLRMRNNHETAV